MEAQTGGGCGRKPRSPQELEEAGRTLLEAFRGSSAAGTLILDLVRALLIKPEYLVTLWPQSTFWSVHLKSLQPSKDGSGKAAW